MEYTFRYRRDRTQKCQKLSGLSTILTAGSVRIIAILGTIGGFLITVAGVSTYGYKLTQIITPLGLSQVLVPLDHENAVFAYIADPSPFGQATPSRAYYGHFRVCGGFAPQV